MNDPYVLPNGVLKNKRNITEYEKLVEAENTFTLARILRIDEKGPKGPFNFDRLKATHHYIFQDVYDWAGQPRIVSMVKLVHYLPHREINQEAKKLFERVGKENEFKGLKTEQFVDAVSEFWAKAYYVHSFREGNTRSLSAFTHAMAKDAGHKLHFDVVSPTRMLEVSSRSILGDMSGVKRLFGEIIDEKRVERLRTVEQELEKQKFDWRNVYIATAEAGESYDGNLIGKGQKEFMVQLKDSRLIVGKIEDFPKNISNDKIIGFTATKEVSEIFTSRAAHYGLTGEKAAEFSRRMQQISPEKSVNQSVNLNKNRDWDRER